MIALIDPAFDWFANVKLSIRNVITREA